MAQPERDEDDADSYDPLAGVDLQKLDLDGIDPEDPYLYGDPEAESTGFPRWLTAFFLASLTGFFLWLPSTEMYQRSGQDTVLFFLVSAGAIVTGLLLGRNLFVWAQEAADRWVARQDRRVRPEEPVGPPSAFARWGTFTLAAGGAVVLLFVIPRDELLNAGRGGGFSEMWFLTVIAAIAVAFLFWRFFVLQGRYWDTLPKQERRPLTIPPWFKWVTLAVLVGFAIVAGFGMQLLPAQDRDSLEFVLGVMGFFVGVGGAIWLARRVEEGERKIQERARRTPPHAKQ